MSAPGAATTRFDVSLPRDRPIGLLLAAGTAGISGIAVFLNASAVKAVPDPAVFTTLKNLVAVAILAVLAAAVVRRAEVRAIGRSDRLALGAIGILGGGVAFLLFFSGLAMASAPSAAFIHKTMVIWVALMAGPFLGERLGLAPVLALVVLVAGQALILPPLGITWGAGETLIALATLIWAVEVVLARRVLGRVRSPVVGVARLGIGLIVLVGYLVLTGRVAGIAAMNAAGWAWVALTGLLLAGYVGTWLAALRRAPATEVTSVLVLGAVITAGLSIATRGTLPEPVASTGYALVLMAVAALIVIGRRATPLTVTASAP
jgi:drug/metabolite transporter (DMT)-like permease